MISRPASAGLGYRLNRRASNSACMLFSDVSAGASRRRRRRRRPRRAIRYEVLESASHYATALVTDATAFTGNLEVRMDDAARTDLDALDIQQLLQYLPHRYPFLLVDRIVKMREDESCVGIKNVTFNEPQFQ